MIGQPSTSPEVPHPSPHQTLAAAAAPIPRPPAEVLRIALALARAIQAAHAEHPLHGDLHPRRIVVDETGSVRLGEPPPPRPELRREMLPYLAPEQSGRTNRPIDYRADYYALGAIAFELLTGRPPFVAADPLELIHAHIATRPPLAHELAPAVPAQLARILDKLLAKDADQRYQSSVGLLADLGRAADELAITGAITAFPLGTDDAPEQLRLPARIYGRERERAQLVAALDGVGGGTPALVVVTGLAGAGKTALVHELRPAVAHAQGLFASGKFDEVGRSVAYSAVRQVLRAIARALLGAGEAALESWQRRLRAALGANRQIVSDFVPELEPILGRLPGVPDVGAAEGKARFTRTLRELFRALAEQAPLVVFLDDLHWSDPASRDLLAQLAAERGARLLLVGALRGEELDAHHPLWATVEQIAAAGTAVHRIEAGPLAPHDLAGMIRDTVGAGAAGDVDALAALVHRKTGGNAFFARFLLARLHADGLLLLDGARRWTWDLAAIAARGITDNVVDLVVRRAAELAPGTRRAVETGACLGTEVRAATVAHALGVERATAEARLAAAVEAGLLQPAGEAGVLQFVHDRVRQSIYETIEPARRPALHLAIARALAAEAAGGARHPTFVIVAQYGRALGLIDDREERQRVAELALAAGRAARISGAFTAAREYFFTGVRALGEAGWIADRALAFALHLGLVESEGLAGEGRGFDELHAELVRRAATPLERAQAGAARLARLAGLGRYRDAIVDGIAALGHLDVPLPAIDDEAAIRAALAATLARHAAAWGDRPIEAHADLPATRDPVHVLAATVLSSLVDCCMIDAPPYLPLVAATAVLYAVEHGNPPMAAMGYASHATVLANQQRFDEAYAYGRLALRLHELAPEPAAAAKVLNTYGAFVHHFKRPSREALPVFREGIRAGLDSGDLLYAMYNGVNLLRAELFAGRPLTDILRDRPRTEARIDALGSATMTQFTQIMFGFAANVAGLSDEPDRLDNGPFHEADYYAAFGAVPLLAAHLHIYRMRAHYLHGRFAEARAMIAAVDPAAIAGQVEWEHLHFFGALARLAESHEPDDGEDVTASCAFVDRLAAACPENFAPHARMLAGERARRCGELLAAVDAFDDAIAIAEAQGLPHEAALAAELAARMWTAAGRARLARPYADAAIAHYRAWGAAALVARLEAQYGAAQLEARRASDGAGDELDVLSVITAASALASEIELPALTDRLMRTVMLIAGATRAVLILHEAGRLRVVGQCDGDRADTVPGTEVADFGELAEPVVRLAARTHRPVVAGDARLEFPECAYVVRTAQRSIFTAPLIKQGELVGILYLENKLVSRAFTAERAHVLELITGQLAIALENARLYEVVMRHASELETKVAVRTEQLRAILDHVTFGFLVVDANLIVQPGYTRSCHELLGGGQIAHCHLADLLGVEAAARGDLELAAARVFDDAAAADAALAALRSRFALPSGVVLGADAKAIRGADGRIEALLISLSDVRAFEEIQRENEANRRLLGILRTKDALQAVADEIHRIEEAVTIGPLHVEQLAVRLAERLGAHRWASGIDLEVARREVVVDGAWLARLAGLIREVPPSARDAAELRRAARCPAGALLGPIESLVENVAARLGKQVELVIEGRDVPVEPQVIESVLRQLPHLLHNAIDHGVEPPDERGAKPPVARLRVAVQDRPDAYAIAVADDGRGIDRAGLVARAVERSVLAPEEAAALSDDELLALIFHDGLAAGREVSPVSGRGVGMAAVRAAVHGCGGRIRVFSVPGAGTTIEMTVPHNVRVAAGTSAV